MKLEQLKYQLEYAERKIKDQKEILECLEEQRDRIKEQIEQLLKQRWLTS